MWLFNKKVNKSIIYFLIILPFNGQRLGTPYLLYVLSLEGKAPVFILKLLAHY